MQRHAGGDPMNRYDELGKSSLLVTYWPFTYVVTLIVNERSPLMDQRTFDGFMNCEPPGKPKFEEQIRLGPLPSVSVHSFKMSNN